MCIADDLVHPEEDLVPQKEDHVLQESDLLLLYNQREKDLLLLKGSLLGEDLDLLEEDLARPEKDLVHLEESRAHLEESHDHLEENLDLLEENLDLLEKDLILLKLNQAHEENRDLPADQNRQFLLKMRLNLHVDLVLIRVIADITGNGLNLHDLIGVVKAVRVVVHVNLVTTKQLRRQKRL